MKRLCRILLILVSLAGMPAPATVWARSEAEIRTAIDDRLSERHPTDTAEWWQSLGPATPRILIRMYRESDRIYHRIRILQGLSWFTEDSEAVQFIKAQTDSATEAALRNAGIRAIARTQGAREKDWVARFLESAETDTRFAAAESLKIMADAGANQALEAHLKTEKVSWIASKLEKVEVPLRTPISPDRVSLEFAGSWSGHWISPSAKGGMSSEPITTRLTALGSEIRGHLELKKRKWEIVRSTGKDLRVRGELAPRGELKAQRAQFEAELVQNLRGWFLEIRVPSEGVFVVLRRSK